MCVIYYAWIYSLLRLIRSQLEVKVVWSEMCKKNTNVQGILPQPMAWVFCLTNRNSPYYLCKSIWSLYHFLFTQFVLKFTRLNAGACKILTIHDYFTKYYWLFHYNHTLISLSCTYLSFSCIFMVINRETNKTHGV